MTALLAGFVWFVQALLSWDDPFAGPVYLIGLALGVLAFAGLGYLLVETAPLWLRALVSVATPALGYAVWVALTDLATAERYLLVGAAAALMGSGLIGRRRADREQAASDASSEAAAPGKHAPQPGRRSAGRRAAR